MPVQSMDITLTCAHGDPDIYPQTFSHLRLLSSRGGECPRGKVQGGCTNAISAHMYDRVTANDRDMND